MMSLYQFPLNNLSIDQHWIVELFKYNPPHFKIPLLWTSLNQKDAIQDLSDLKSLLIVGTQSTGKTTFIHQLVLLCLFKRHPSQLKLVLVDHKGLELSIYRPIEKHFLAKMKDAEDPIIRDLKVLIRTLNSLIIEMENRYELLQNVRVKN